MRFDDGLRICEFRWASGLSNAAPMLRFGNKEEATFWLTRIRSRFPQLPRLARQWLALRTPHTCSRFTDLEVMGQLANLLVSRSIVVLVREKPRVSGFSQAPAQQPAFVAFPLPKSRPTSPPPARAVVKDPDTFPETLDPRTQAAVLVAAASSGAPFCPE